MTALELTRIGSSLGVILLNDVLARLKLGKVETVFVIDAVNGVMLTPHRPEFEAQMALARQVLYVGLFHHRQQRRGVARRCLRRARRVQRRQRLHARPCVADSLQ